MRKLLLVPALVLFAGCSDDHPDSCAVFTTDGDLLICIEYAERVTDPEGNCATAGGAFRTSRSCEGGAVGVCSGLAGDAYYYPDYFALGITVDVARMACEDSGGEFTEL